MVAELEEVRKHLNAWAKRWEQSLKDSGLWTKYAEADNALIDISDKLLDEIEESGRHD